MPRSKSRPTPRRPLKVSNPFRPFVLDQLGDLGDVVARSMFGGVGLYHRGFFFGIIARDVLYLKVDDTNRLDYVRAKMKPFKPYAGRPTTMKYYEVPLEVLESTDELISWARRSMAVAETNQKA